MLNSAPMPIVSSQISPGAAECRANWLTRDAFNAADDESALPANVFQIPNWCGLRYVALFTLAAANARIRAAGPWAAGRAAPKQRRHANGKTVSKHAACRARMSQGSRGHRPESEGAGGGAELEKDEQTTSGERQPASRRARGRATHRTHIGAVQEGVSGRAGNASHLTGGMPNLCRRHGAD